MSQKSVKRQAIDDHLANHPLSDDESVQAEFPDETLFAMEKTEEQRTWTLYFDGALNSKGKGVGVVLTSPEGIIIPGACELVFPSTHNIAEYEALICGLRMTILLNVKYLRIIGNS